MKNLYFNLIPLRDDCSHCYRVTYGDKIGTTFKILANKAKNRKKILRIETEGTCCWKILDRDGTSEIFGVDEGRNTKSVQYITRIITMKC